METIKISELDEITLDSAVQEGMVFPVTKEGVGTFKVKVPSIGKDCVDGKDGKDGIDGKDGKDGVDGKDGKDGVDGKDATLQRWQFSIPANSYSEYFNLEDLDIYEVYVRIVQVSGSFGIVDDAKYLIRKNYGYLMKKMLTPASGTSINDYFATSFGSQGTKPWRMQNKHPDSAIGVIMVKVN